MADSDISFHGGTPGPSNPNGAYGWSSDGDSDDGGKLNGAEGSPQATPPNPVAFGTASQAGK